MPCASPLDMRAGTDAALARVVKVFGSARRHHAYLFANRRAKLLKVLVRDGIGIWLAARASQGRFAWPGDSTGEQHSFAQSSSMRWYWACRGNASASVASLV